VRRRASPQEKKAADYKKQRRSHWDSNKAARKAIPLSKALRNRGIRHTSDKLVAAAVSAAAAGDYQKI